VGVVEGDWVGGGGGGGGGGRETGRQRGRERGGEGVGEGERLTSIFNFSTPDVFSFPKT